jgi:gamma-glutamyltranspeptidase/glutathione hydrolase
MTPTIILKDEKLFMVLGSPGGTTIPTSVFQTIVNIIDFKMSAYDAINSPRFHHEWLPDVISMETGLIPKDTLDALMKIGYQIKNASLGRVELIQKLPDGNLDIVADRRGGMDCAEGY